MPKKRMKPCGNDDKSPQVLPTQSDARRGWMGTASSSRLSRNNSVESVETTSSSPSSSSSEDEDDFEPKTRLPLFCQQQQKVKMAGGSLGVNCKMAKRHPSNWGSSDLCSIPEDGGPNLPSLFATEEEPIYHRSPVSLANGYKPSHNSVLNVPDTISSKPTPTAMPTTATTRPSRWVDATFKWMLALVYVALKCFAAGLCLLSLVAVLLLLSHHYGHSEKPYDISQDTKDDTLLSNQETSMPEAVSEEPSSILTPNGETDDETDPVPSDVDLVVDTNKYDDEEMVKEEPVESDAVEEIQIPVVEERYVVKAVPKSSLVEEEEEKRDEPSQEEKPPPPPPPPKTEENTSSDEPAQNETASVDHEEKGEEVVQVVTEEPLKVEVKEETNKTEPEIPSFREWTQKALEEEQKKREEEKRKKEEEKEKKKREQQQKLKNAEPNVNATLEHHVAPIIPHRLKKNFASLDCGAKIAGANPEAQSALNIISPSRDEYMLNKCTDKVWFVIELCESIKAYRIEIANFELYSSVPHDFRVSLGNVYPGRDTDWTLFGNFKAADERTVQSFSSPDGVFGKYAKVEILSHHQSEHYCPVSLFKIYGISEIELIGQDDDDDPHHADHYEDHSATEASQSSDNMLNFIRDTVGETLQKVVGVFTPREQIKNVDMSLALDKSSLVGNTFLYDVSCPGCNLDRYRDVYFLLAANYPQLAGTLARSQALHNVLATQVCSSYGFNITVASDFSDNDTCAGFRLVEFYATLFGTSRIMALCNVIGIQQGRHILVDAHTDGFPDAVKKNHTHVDIRHHHQVKPNNIKIDSGPTAQQPTDQQPKPTDTTAVDDAAASTDTTPSASTIHQSSSGSQGTATSSVAPSQHSSLKVSSQSHEQLVVTSSEEDSSKQRIVPTPVTATTDTVSATSTGEEDVVAAAQVGKKEELKEPPRVVIVPPSDKSQVHHTSSSGDQTTETTGSKTPPVPNNSQGGRESVWQKLSNRIKTLERDVTLSSGYLEELSVRYRKQIEDLQLSVRQSGESQAAVAKTREQDRNTVMQLQSQVANLTELVHDLNTRIEMMSTWAIGVHAFILVLEISMGFLFMFVCLARLRQQQQQQQPTQSNVQTDVKVQEPPSAPVSSTPMKRRHSLEDIKAVSGDDVKNKRRRSLDLSKGGHFGRKLNGHIPGSWESLSRKQRKRLQRRLSRDHGCGALREERIEDILEDSLSRRSSESSDWQQVPRTGSMDRLADKTPVMQNVILSEPPVITTGNMFGILNHSLHDDPTPLKQRALDFSPRVLSHRRRKLFNGHTTDAELGGSSGSIDGGKQNVPHVSRQGGHKPKSHRSKSTSPTRPGPTAKQRDRFKKFNPESIDWIQK